MLLQPRSVLLAALVVLSTFPSPAYAATPTIYARHEGIRTVDPIAANFVDANHSARANLTTGLFGALATTPANEVASSTGAGLETNLTFTNNNPFPFTIWRGTLGAHFEGTYSVVPPGPSIGTGADSNVFLAVLTTGPTGANYSVSLDHALRTNGIPLDDVNQVTPESTGGATFVVTAASFTHFAGELRMPTITLLPGQMMVLAFQMDAFAQRNSLADFFGTGGTELHFDLPAGITLATNATIPLNWVSVPEPSGAAMLVAGIAALTALARRRELPAR